MMTVEQCQLVDGLAKIVGLKDRLYLLAGLKALDAREINLSIEGCKISSRELLSHRCWYESDGSDVWNILFVCPAGPNQSIPGFYTVGSLK